MEEQRTQATNGKTPEIQGQLSREQIGQIASGIREQAREKGTPVRGVLFDYLDNRSGLDPLTQLSIAERLHNRASTEAAVHLIIAYCKEKSEVDKESDVGPERIMYQLLPYLESLPHKRNRLASLLEDIELVEGWPAGSIQKAMRDQQVRQEALQISANERFTLEQIKKLLELPPERRIYKTVGLGPLSKERLARVLEKLDVDPNKDPDYENTALEFPRKYWRTNEEGLYVWHSINPQTGESSSGWVLGYYRPYEEEHE